MKEHAKLFKQVYGKYVMLDERTEK